MSDYEQDEDVYIIPHNYQENGKILGIIEKSSFYLGTAWSLVWFFIFFFIGGITLTTKIILFIFIALFPTGIVFAGIGHDTVVDFVKYYINFNKNARVYKYEK